MKVFTAFCTVFHFPKSVSDYLVARFPEYLPNLSSNDSVDPGSFDGVLVAKQPADVAQNLLGMNNPGLVTTWCKSRDKRQGTCDKVLRHWYLPLDSQHAFASKALSQESARDVLRSAWFADSAKLVAAPRALAFDVWNWLESDPTSLTDAEWLQAFNLASASVQREQLSSCYSTLMQRPHLAQSLVADGTPAARALAVSMVSWIDPVSALERLAGEENTDLFRLGLLAMLDHPSLPHAVRKDGFELAARRGVSRDVYRLGCPSPGSPLALALPLGSLVDPLQVELAASRTLQHPHRMAQFAQLVSAPAASEVTLYRLDEVSARNAYASPGFLQPLAALAKRVNGEHALSVHARNVIDSLAERNRLRELAERLEVPTQHAPGRRERTWWYGSSDTPPLTAEDVLESQLDEVVSKVVGYHVAENAAEVFSATVLERLGDASDAVSQKHWESFVQLLPRTAGSMKFKSVLSTAVRLR